jgi:four helix bundle protein
MKTMKSSFEELLIWQRAMSLAEKVHVLTRNRMFDQDWDFRSQMRRASTSVPLNIAEGFERGTLADSIKFYYIAKGSAGELRTQSVLAGRFGYLERAEADGLISEAGELSRMIMGFIRSAQERAALTEASRSRSKSRQ